MYGNERHQVVDRGTFKTSRMLCGRWVAVSCAIAIVASVPVVRGAPGSLYGRMQPVALDSARLDNLRAEAVVVFSQILDLGPDVPWLRVFFEDANLPPGSAVRVTSLLDGESQILDAEELTRWGNGTAFFNGSAVMIELVAGPQTFGNRVRIGEVYAGKIPEVESQVDPADEVGRVAAICGGADNRSTSSDPAVGRLLRGTPNAPDGGGCTAFIIDSPPGLGSKLHLTAGHCFDPGGYWEWRPSPPTTWPIQDLIATSITVNIPTSAKIHDVNVDLTISHGYVGDLVVTLEHNGTTVTLINRPVGGTGNCDAHNYDDIILDDEAPFGQKIDSECQDNLTSPLSYRPSSPLSAFDGMDRAGDWKITVSDHAVGDEGRLVQWSLSIPAEWSQSDQLRYDYVLQFDVPPSGTNCAITHPLVKDQFAVRKDTVISQNQGLGNDWAVFQCYQNKLTELTTYQEQNRWAFPLASAIPIGPPVRVIGYGTDGGVVPNACGNRNARCVNNNPDAPQNQVQQSDDGNAFTYFLTPSGTEVLAHDADTCGGNSGSPIMNTTTPTGYGEVLGIHTWGACKAVNGENAGTPITHTGLRDAIQRIKEKKKIPTVSEWGMVVLALLLLSGIAIKFGRRRGSIRTV